MRNLLDVGDNDADLQWNKNQTVNSQYPPLIFINIDETDHEQKGGQEEIKGDTQTIRSSDVIGVFETCSGCADTNKKQKVGHRNVDFTNV